MVSKWVGGLERKVNLSRVVTFMRYHNEASYIFVSHTCDNTFEQILKMLSILKYRSISFEFIENILLIFSNIR